MTKEKDTLEVEGKIIDTLPNATFTVELDGGHKLLSTISGRMRINFIRILPGDKVRVRMTKYDINRGVIVYRYK